jgi:hypothetical protein
MAMVGLPGTRTDRSPGDRVGRGWRRRLAVLALLVAAAAAYVGVVTLRHGPPPGGDTVPLTSVTTALAAGDLHAAAAVSSLPNPPGYALVVAPVVAAFRPWVDSPTWCNPRTSPTVTVGASMCGGTDRLPPWYRSQGVLGLVGWLALALGSLALLRAGDADTLANQAGLLAFLVVLPAASSAIVQLYHPQDLVSLGLALAGLAQALHRRWLWAGALFGAAFLTKQFAVLLLLPALVVAPDIRARVRLALMAALVFAAGIVPFMTADPRATLDNLSGFSAGGAAAGQTVLSLMGVTGAAASAVARDAPVVFAAATCVWVLARYGSLLHRPAELLALTLVCTASRLVFESVIFPYYLLAASVSFLLLDLVSRRAPARSLAWCAAVAFFVAVRPADHAVEALGTLAFAGAAVAIGLVDLRHAGPARQDRPSPATPEPA